MKTNTSNQTAQTKKIFSNSYRNRKPSSEKQKANINIKRQYLKELSKPIRELKNIGEVESINEGLKQIYEAQGHTNLKTIRQWNEKGYKVKKGEHALLLWGSKKTTTHAISDENTDLDPYDFFPICFVFSKSQVEEREVKND